MELTLFDLERFWSYVGKAGKDDCWLWKGGITKSGYGAFDLRGRTLGAHRLALTLTCGPLGPDIQACHRCDVRACCNPNHLFAGTARDNTRDMIEKGRKHSKVGDRHHMARLTDAKVTEIRRRRAAGEPGSALAKEYGVSHQAVCDLVARRTWAHLPDERLAVLA